MIKKLLPYGLMALGLILLFSGWSEPLSLLIYMIGLAWLLIRELSKYWTE